MNEDVIPFQRISNSRWMKIQPPADVTDFEKNEMKDVSLKPSHLTDSKSGRNYAEAKLIW